MSSCGVDAGAYPSVSQILVLSPLQPEPTTYRVLPTPSTERLLLSLRRDGVPLGYKRRCQARRARRVQHFHFRRGDLRARPRLHRRVARGPDLQAERGVPRACKCSALADSVAGWGAVGTGADGGDACEDSRGEGARHAGEGEASAVVCHLSAACANGDDLEEAV